MVPSSRLNRKCTTILAMLEVIIKQEAVLVTFTGKERALLV